MTTQALAAGSGRRWHRTLPRRPTLSDVPVWGGAAAAAMGTIVLIGWIVGPGILKTMWYGLPTMKANAAICLILLGTAVVLRAGFGARSTQRWVALGLIGAAAAVALATGAEYLFGAGFGIDELLFREPAAMAAGGIAGRMSPLAAICFVLLAAGAALGARSPRTVVGLSAVALALSVLNVLTFVLSATIPSFLVGYSQMALTTAIAIGILSVAVIGLLGPASPFAPLADRSPGTLVLRGALALSIGVPLVLIALTLGGERLGIFGSSYGIALRNVGVMATGVIAALAAAGWVTEMEAKRLAIEIERDRFFDLSLDMMSVVGADSHFQRVNKAWESALGYRPEDLVGRSYLDLIHPDDRQRTIDQVNRHFGDGEPVEQFHNRCQHVDGSYRWLEWVSQTAPDGSVAFAVARDVTARKQSEERREHRQRALEGRNRALAERTLRDPLTGLHNRRSFDETVGRQERRWTRLAVNLRPPVSVILFDLDHFGQINKQHGHQAGDAVLRAFAVLLKKRFREQDLVTRYGGEEFVAVLEGATISEAIRTANDIRTTLERTAVDIGTTDPIRVTVSAGCAQLGDDASLAGGLTLADLWLSQAKRGGRNQVVGL